MFGKGKAEEYSKLPGPVNLPDVVGRYIIVYDKGNPDEVWKMKSVVRQIGKKEYFCRVYDAGKVSSADLNVNNWDSFNDYPQLVIWEGYYNKDTNEARPQLFADFAIK